MPPKSLSVPLINFPSLIHSLIKPTTEALDGPNSLEVALFILNLFLANSITAICIPKQIPKNGILFSRAYFMAAILPSVPLLPNPPGIKIPETSFNLFLISLSFNLSDSILIRLTFNSLSIPPCVSASSKDL